MRLLSYVVTHDAGFAPNPFWGFYTLAACTPNHMGVRAKQDDWILGNSSLDTGQRLIYAMQISEILDFDNYFRDERFAKKKANGSSWQERCGDNIYFRSRAGRWSQARTFYHTEAGRIEQDTRHPRVFVSDYFFYFGEDAPEIPHKYAALIQSRQGCTWHEGKLVETFIDWLEGNDNSGLRGLPRDREDETDMQCSSVERRNEIC
jgi:hypothetical protein